MVLSRSATRLSRSLLPADASAAVPAPESVAAPVPTPEELVEVEDWDEEDDEVEEVHAEEVHLKLKRYLKLKMHLLKLEMHMLKLHKVKRKTKLDMEGHLNLELYHHHCHRLSQRSGL